MSHTVVINLDEVRKLPHIVCKHVSICKLRRVEHPPANRLFGCCDGSTYDVKLVLMYGDLVNKLEMLPAHDPIVRCIKVEVYMPMPKPGEIVMTSSSDIGYTKSFIIPEEVEIIMFGVTAVDSPPPHAIYYDNDQSWQRRAKVVDFDNTGPLS